jgi:hypothetical protein
MISRPTRFVPLLLGIAAVLSGLWADVANVRVATRDTNRDGRPDVWQYYDRHGALLHIDIDTNFDGRADIQESYAGGQLVRRESDLNFDDRIDTVDEFDAVTGARIRTVVDEDFDGRADLEVLLSGGVPVFSNRSTAPRRTALQRPGARQSDEPLAQLDDPFAGIVRVRGTAPADASVLLAAVRWTVAQRTDVAAAQTLAPHRVVSIASAPRLAARAPALLRGPPPASLPI